MAESGRKIGVAMDFSKGSKEALKWAIDGLLVENDTLYILHVVKKLSKVSESRNLIWSTSGSPLIPWEEFKIPEVMHGYGVELDPEIRELLNTAFTQHKVDIVGKIDWGDAREKLCDAVSGLKLDLIIMGSRGLGSIQRVLLGSVTSYVIENAPCPVTVVKEPKC